MIRLILLFSLFSLSGLAQVSHSYVAAKMNGVMANEDGTTIPIWGYGNYSAGVIDTITLPGPLLRYNFNDSVNIHFWNDSPEDHTIHLHGLDASQANDGVPTTSVAIGPNDSITYKFKAKHAGTFLYHCHVTTTLHLTMGMYGMLVVDYPGNLLYQNGPGYNKEYTYLYSDMDRTWNFSPISPGPFYLYDPTDFYLNGLSGTQLFDDTTQIIRIYPQDSVLLRLANVGYTIVEYIFPSLMNATIEMSDGRPAPSPLAKDTLRIYPGERFSVMMRPDFMHYGYIEVNSINMFTDSTLYTNYIGINEQFHPTGIADSSRDPDWTIYPNPNNGQFTIQSISAGNYHIYNISGALIKQMSLESGEHQISLGDLNNGVYYIVDAESGLYKQFVVAR